MRREHDLVDVECRIIHETDKAYLISDGKTKEWVPKSVVEWDAKNKVMTMPEGLAYEKGFI